MDIRYNSTGVINGLTERLEKAVFESGLEAKDFINQGIPHASYYRILYHDSVPTIPVLIKFCKILNVSADYLLGLEEKKVKVSL